MKSNVHERSDTAAKSNGQAKPKTSESSPATTSIASEKSAVPAKSVAPVKSQDSESSPVLKHEGTSQSEGKAASTAEDNKNNKLSEFIPLAKDPDPMSLNGLLNPSRELSERSSAHDQAQSGESNGESNSARNTPVFETDTERSESKKDNGTGIALADFQGFSTSDNNSSSPKVSQVNGIRIDGVDTKDIVVLKPFPDGMPNAESSDSSRSGSSNEPLAVTEIKPLPNLREESNSLTEQAGLRPLLPKPISSYTVQQGDSLESIRKKYNMSDEKYEYFLILNDLKNKTVIEIKPGMNLLIP